MVGVEAVGPISVVAVLDAVEAGRHSIRLFQVDAALFGELLVLRARTNPNDGTTEATMSTCERWGALFAFIAAARQCRRNERSEEQQERG